MLRGAKPSISGQGRGLKTKAQRAESGGWGSWGGAARPSPTSQGVWESSVSYPSGIRAESRPLKGFLAFLVKILCIFLVYCFFLYYVCFYLRVNKDEYILEAPDGLSWNLLGAKFGGLGPLGPHVIWPAYESIDPSLHRPIQVPPAPIRTRRTCRLNPGNSGGLRNVPI